MNLRLYHIISEVFFRQMTIARNEDINKDDTSILHVDLFKNFYNKNKHSFCKFSAPWPLSSKKKTFSFRKHFSTVLSEEIRIAKFCTEVFVIPRHFMTKLYIPKASLYTSPLRAIVLSH